MDKRKERNQTYSVVRNTGHAFGDHNIGHVIESTNTPSIADLVSVLSLGHTIGQFMPLKIASPSFPKK